MKVAGWLALGLALTLVAGAAAQVPIAAPGGFVPRQALSFSGGDGKAVGVDAAHPLPVASSVAAATYTDISGAIATGGAAQAIDTANAQRQGFFVQNLSTADLWINFGSAAVGGRPALRLAPGQLYESPPRGAPAQSISIWGATTGQSFTAREW